MTLATPPLPETNRAGSLTKRLSVRVIDRRWWARAADGGADGESPRESDKPAYVQELEQRLAAKDEELRDHHRALPRGLRRVRGDARAAPA